MDIGCDDKADTLEHVLEHPARHKRTMVILHDEVAFEGDDVSCA